MLAALGSWWALTDISPDESTIVERSLSAAERERLERLQAMFPGDQGFALALVEGEHQAMLRVVDALRDVPGIGWVSAPGLDGALSAFAHPQADTWVLLLALEDGYRDWVRARTLVAVVHCEQAPDPQSRVRLSDRLDRLGQPRLRLHWRVGEGEMRSARRLLDGLDLALRSRGLGELRLHCVEDSFGDASHHMGTTRMGLEPRHSVVDPDCRVHGLENLFVAGSSVFPTGGYANPTLTIVALALRLGALLRDCPG